MRQKRLNGWWQLHAGQSQPAENLHAARRMLRTAAKVLVVLAACAMESLRACVSGPAAAVSLWRLQKPADQPAHLQSQAAASTASRLQRRQASHLHGSAGSSWQAPFPKLLQHLAHNCLQAVLGPLQHQGGLRASADLLSLRMCAACRHASSLPGMLFLLLLLTSEVLQLLHLGCLQHAAAVAARLCWPGSAHQHHLCAVMLAEPGSA